MEGSTRGGGARDMGRRHLIERRGTVWFPIWVNDPWVCQTPNMLGGLRARNNKD